MYTKATTDDDVRAIKKLAEEFFAGVNAGDLDRRMATMDPDAVIMPPDRPSIVGKEEIRRLSHDYSTSFEEQCSLVYDEVEAAGNLQQMQEATEKLGWSRPRGRFLSALVFGTP